MPQAELLHRFLDIRGAGAREHRLFMKKKFVNYLGRNPAIVWQGNASCEQLTLYYENDDKVVID